MGEALGTSAALCIVCSSPYYEGGYPLRPSVPPYAVASVRTKVDKLSAPMVAVRSVGPPRGPPGSATDRVGRVKAGVANRATSRRDAGCATRMQYIEYPTDVRLSSIPELAIRLRPIQLPGPCGHARSRYGYMSTRTCTHALLNEPRPLAASLLHERRSCFPLRCLHPCSRRRHPQIAPVVVAGRHRSHRHHPLPLAAPRAAQPLSARRPRVPQSRGVDLA